MSLENLSKIIESAIAQLGMKPEEARTEGGGQWNIAKNENIQIMLDVWEEQGHWFFQTLSPVCPIGDENNAEFFRLLLEENHGFAEAAFTILDDGVFLKYTIEAEGLTETHVINSITRIAYYNELFQEKMN
jgi:hypothetical protein